MNSGLLSSRSYRRRNEARLASEVVPGGQRARCSMAFCGFGEPTHRGKACRSDIPHTRPAIVASGGG